MSRGTARDVAGVGRIMLRNRLLKDRVVFYVVLRVFSYVIVPLCTIERLYLCRFT